MNLATLDRSTRLRAERRMMLRTLRDRIASIAFALLLAGACYGLLILPIL